MRSPTFALALMVCFAEFAAADQAPTGPELLDKSRAKYAALQTYSDTGVTVNEFNGGSPTLMRERSTFTTYFRAPKQFFFDFKADPAASNDRFVIWIDGAEVNSWWKATAVHEKYPQGQGATAFAVGALPTKGAVDIVASLLFPGLQGIIADLKEARLIGTENVDTHRCYKIAGDFAPAYGNGTVTSTSTVTVWIDADSLLIRKIFADTPKESGTTVIDRSTTTFDPRANPVLKPEIFRFVVPSTQ